MTETLTDSAIICAAQKVEHYEIAGYGTLSAWAKHLGLDEVAELFDETLEEEKAADAKLTDVGLEILTPDATDAEDSSEEDEASTIGTGAVPKKGMVTKARNETGSRRTEVSYSCVVVQRSFFVACLSSPLRDPTVVQSARFETV